MAWGFVGHSVDIISWENLQKLCPDECNEILQEMNKFKLTLDEFIALICDTDPLGVDDYLSRHPTLDINHLVNLFDALAHEFNSQTCTETKGLDLFVGYHDSGVDGDCYDEVDGGYFVVGGVYEKTPAGKRFADQIVRSFFVTYE